MSITEINAIDETFPVAGIDQPSDKFRDNFGNIKTALLDLDGQVVTIINDLDDVDTITSAPVTNDVLLFDGADWVPGVPATNIVLDTTPQLGGNLDVNGFSMFTGGEVVLSYSSGGETAVNWIDIQNSITAIAPAIKAIGPDANVDMILSTKGTSAVVIASGTTTSRIKAEAGSSLEISTQVDAVGRNITLLAGAAAGESGGNGGSVNIIPGAGDGAGSAGTILLRDKDNNVVATFAGPLTGTGVNTMAFISSATGNSPALRMFGADIDVGFQIVPKGAGRVALAGLKYPAADGTVGQSLTTDGSGNLSFTTPPGSGDLLAANNLNDVVNSQTSIDNLTNTNTVEVNQLVLADHGSNGQMWTIEEDGSATNAITFDYNSIERMRITTSGDFADNEGNIIVSLSKAGESAVNWIDIENATVGNSPTIASVGSETNVNLNLTAKGSGKIRISGIGYPNADGSSGDVLTTDGSGTVGFAAPLGTDPTVWPFRIDAGPAPAILSTDGVVIIGSGGPPQAAVLPSASSVPAGKQITLKLGPGTVSATITPFGADTIDSTPGPNAALLALLLASTTLVSDGVTGWFAV